MCVTISLIIAATSISSGVGLFTMLCLCKAASDADDAVEDMMYNQE